MSELSSPDLQRLLRKIYVAERLDRTKVTLAQRHEAQRRYVIEKRGQSYVARLKDAKP